VYISFFSVTLIIMLLLLTFILILKRLGNISHIDYSTIMREEFGALLILRELLILPGETAIGGIIL
jgi:hypothetical protein